MNLNWFNNHLTLSEQIIQWCPWSGVNSLFTRHMPKIKEHCGADGDMLRKNLRDVVCNSIGSLASITESTSMHLELRRFVMILILSLWTPFPMRNGVEWSHRAGTLRDGGEENVRTWNDSSTNMVAILSTSFDNESRQFINYLILILWAPFFNASRSRVESSSRHIMRWQRREYSDM